MRIRLGFIMNRGKVLHPNDVICDLKLHPKVIDINIEGMDKYLLNYASITIRDKVKTIFECYSLVSGKFIPISPDDKLIKTNLPYLLFFVKHSTSERLYLYHTLSGKAYLSATKKDINFLKETYIQRNLKLTLESNFEISNGTVKYDRSSFIDEPSNQEYITSLLANPNFQSLLRKITGINELAYLNSNCLAFNYNLTYQLRFKLKIDPYTDFEFLEIQGDRLTYQADQTQDEKVFLIDKKLFDNYDQIKEIYWLNSKYYLSIYDENVIKDKHLFFLANRFDKPTLEDLMIVGFADFLLFKTYYPDSIIPARDIEYSLLLFSTIFLIEYILYPNKPFNQTIASNIVDYICLYKQVVNKESGLPSDTPINIKLNVMPKLNYLREAKKLLFKINPTFEHMSINPAEFIPYLIQSFKGLTESEKTYDRFMYNLIFNNALDSYMADYIEQNMYIDRVEACRTFKSICKIKGVDYAIFISKFICPEKVYAYNFDHGLDIIERLKPLSLLR